MSNRIYVWATLLFTYGATAAAAPLIVRPDTALESIPEKLASDASIAEVVFEQGIYHGGLHIAGPQGPDSSKSPLLIRAADGAKVLFDGAAKVEKFEPVEGMPGVFRMQYNDRGGEAPKLWEPRLHERRLRIRPPRRPAPRQTHLVPGRTQAPDL